MELNRLIETEQRNDTLVRRAAVMAEGLVRAAQEEVVRNEAAFSDELQELAHAGAAAIAAERATRVASIHASAASEIARYELLTSASVDAVVAMLVAELVADGSGR